MQFSCLDSTLLLEVTGKGSHVLVMQPHLLFYTELEEVIMGTISSQPWLTWAKTDGSRPQRHWRQGAQPRLRSFSIRMKSIRSSEDDIYLDLKPCIGVPFHRLSSSQSKIKFLYQRPPSSDWKGCMEWAKMDFRKRSRKKVESFSCSFRAECH